MRQTPRACARGDTDIVDTRDQNVIRSTGDRNAINAQITKTIKATSVQYYHKSKINTQKQFEFFVHGSTSEPLLKVLQRITAATRWQSAHDYKASGSVIVAKIAIVNAAQGPDEKAFPAIDINSLSFATPRQEALRLAS